MPPAAPMPPEPAQEDDAALGARCRRGDPAAWATLVQRYQRLVYTVALRAGHDAHVAADVFQTVFARLVEHLPRIADPSRLQAWIVTTAKREALLLLRRGARTVSMTREGDDAEDSAPDWDVADDAALPEQALDELQQAHRLRLALEQLDRRCRELLALLFRDEDDAVASDEVARRMDMPQGSIGPTRARCLAKLRRLVE
jgi:RNA polymerase sigma factor (sigma-70 family)